MTTRTAQTLTVTEEIDAEIVALQGARIDAANNLADADAQYRTANAPESDASPEEVAVLRAARDAAQGASDEAEADLSAALTQRRRDAEDDARGE